jgi:hypothetical protein
MQLSLENLNHIAEIAFWLVAGTLGILTYRQAKSTFFQPMRAEVFKIQVEAVRTVMDSYWNESEDELREKFDLRGLVAVNASAMFDRYARRSKAKDSWAGYKHDPVVVTQAFTDAWKELRGLLIDPSLPPDLIDLLSNLAGDVRAYERSIGPLMEAAAQKLPERVKAAGSLGKLGSDWIFELAEMPRLEPRVAEIIDYVRHWFDPGGFAPRRRKRGGTARR